MPTRTTVSGQGMLRQDGANVVDLCLCDSWLLILGNVDMSNTPLILDNCRVSLGLMTWGVE